MAFATFDKVKKVNNGKEPVLCWLEAPAGTGKSTLIAEFFRKFNPAVIVPMDQRAGIYEELLAEGVQVFPVSADPTEWADENAILKAMRQNIPGSGVVAGAIDSMTPRFREIISDAQDVAEMSAEERKRITGNSNKISAYQDKARFMEKMAVFANFGINFVWVGHEFEGRDNKAQVVTKTTITKQEREKFRRNLNLHLRTGIDRGKYFVEVIWARERPELTGQKFFDEAGMFKGMWDKILASYEGAKVVAWDDVEYWQKPDDAIAAAMEVYKEAPNGSKVHAFDVLNHAQNAYEKVKKTVAAEVAHDDWKAKHRDDPAAAAKLMARRWKEDVAKRIDKKLNPPAETDDLVAAAEEMGGKPQPALMDVPEEEPAFQYQ